MTVSCDSWIVIQHCGAGASVCNSVFVAKTFIDNHVDGGAPMDVSVALASVPPTFDISIRNANNRAFFINACVHVPCAHRRIRSQVPQSHRQATRTWTGKRYVKDRHLILIHIPDLEKIFIGRDWHPAWIQPTTCSYFHCF